MYFPRGYCGIITQPLIRDFVMALRHRVFAPILRRLLRVSPAYRVMGNPRRGFPTEKPLGGFSPLLRFVSFKISPFAKGETGLCPVTPPPFEKGGRKL